MARIFLAHVDLVVRDMAASLDFYCKQLGFDLVEDTLLEGELPLYLSKGASNAVRLVLLRSSRIGAALELLEFAGQSRQVIRAGEAPEFRNNVSFMVDDLAALLASLRAADVVPRSPVFRVALPHAGHSEIVLYHDPDGHVLEFIQKSIPAR